MGINLLATDVVSGFLQLRLDKSGQGYLFVETAGNPVILKH